MEPNSNRASRTRALSRAAAAGGCALCCGIPMLVVVGVVSAGAAITSGVLAGSLLLVLATTASILTGRLPRTAERWQLALFAAGGAASFAGIWGAASQRPQSHLVISIGVAVLAVAALLSLATEDRQRFWSRTPPAGGIAMPARNVPEEGTT